MNSAERVVRRWWEDVWGKGDLDAIDELLAEPYIRHDHRGTRKFTRAEYKKEMADYLRAVAAAKSTIDDVAVSGDRVWARITSRGVNLSAEQAVTLTWLQAHRVADDRLAESWVLYKVGTDWTV